MKITTRAVFSAVLTMLVLSIAPSSAQAGPWSAVGSTCAPDDDAPYTRYEIQPSSGYTEFKTGITGYNYFTCNVTTPIDPYPANPDWTVMYLTFKDPDANGYVRATLYRKDVATGAVRSLTSVTSTDGVGVRDRWEPIPLLDFERYAYFVRITMYRSNTSSDQEFHLVRLVSLVW